MGKITKQELSPDLVTEIEGASSGLLSAQKEENHIEILTESGIVYHGISNLAESFDFVQVFANSTLLAKDIHYTIDAEKINKISGTWNAGTKFDFFAIKFISEAQYLSATYDTERIVIAVESNTIAHGLANFSRDFDLLQVYINSVYAARDVQYALNDNLTITKLSGNFEIGDIVNLVRVRFVPNVAIASAGEVDYDNTTSGLNATRIQGAIDEVNSKINIYEDQGIDPNYIGVKYKLVVVDGVAFMEVVES